MALKFKISKEDFDKLTEAEKALYKAGTDGTYQLDVEGAESSDAFAGLKKNQDALIKEKRELQAALEELKKLGDPEKIKEALAKLQEVEEKKLLDAGEIDQLLQNRTENMRKDFENKLATAHKALDDAKENSGKLTERLHREVVERQILEAVNAIGAPRPEALLDIVGRGRTVWGIDEDGNPVPKDQAGNVILGADAKNPMTMAEWAKNLSTTAAHLFLPSQGGGSKGSKSGKPGLSADEIDKMSPSQLMAMGRGNATQGANP